MFKVWWCMPCFRHSRNLDQNKSFRQYELDKIGTDQALVSHNSHLLCQCQTSHWSPLHRPLGGCTITVPTAPWPCHLFAHRHRWTRSQGPTGCLCFRSRPFRVSWLPRSLILIIVERSVSTVSALRSPSRIKISSKTVPLKPPTLFAPPSPDMSIRSGRFGRHFDPEATSEKPLTKDGIVFQTSALWVKSKRKSMKTR